MNHIEKVAEMWGVEIGEEFKIAYDDKTLSAVSYVLLNEGMFCSEGHWVSAPFIWHLIKGEYKIVKLPWKPKNGDKYYYPGIFKKDICATYFNGCTVDYALLSLGMCYRTYEEAEAHLAEDYKKLTGKELEE